MYNVPRILKPGFQTPTICPRMRFGSVHVDEHASVRAAAEDPSERGTSVCRVSHGPMSFQ